MSEDKPPEIAAAYKEAKSRGLPDGWTCTIDKRNRRKWTAPNNGRSCDSIPKAIAISVELGLLPSDTVVPSGRKKKKRPVSASRPRKRVRDDTAAAAASLLSMVSIRPAVASIKNDEPEGEVDVDDGESSSEDEGPPPIPMDPETTLDVNVPTGTISRKDATLPSTVHWDPTSPNGRKVGWKVKIENRNNADGWIDGRVVRYDPHTHKHKIVFENNNNRSACWIWLRNEQHNLQMATRMVWAHVKGYAWWPALVMESNSEAAKTREGYVLIEFFGTGEISCLRDTPESVLSFDPGSIDPVVTKHRKKCNIQAFALACEEFALIRKTRNEAALYYAKAALGMSCYYAPKNANASSIAAGSQALIGKRIQIFRSDVNYPYGDTVVGTVRQYSQYQKKWLLSFELSEKQSNKTKYAPTWINLYGKENALKVLDKDSAAETSKEDLVPFLFGFEPYTAASKEGGAVDNDYIELMDLMKSRCRGCVEYLKVGGGVTKNTAAEQLISCNVCQGSFHLNCVDPPMTVEMWQRMIKDRTVFVCARCTSCRGCYEKDIAFGSHAHPSPPSMLSLPETDSGKISFNLCAMCKYHYDAERFCPNCAHIWDDKKFGMVRRQIEYGNSSANTRKSKGGSRDVIEDSESQLLFGNFEGDEILSLDVKVDPCFFYPETSEWGFTEDEMLVCDSCNVWVHAGCSGMTEDEYDVTSNGDHPIYSKEFLCRMCCRKRCKELIEALQQEDKIMLFAAPVSEKVVPNYYDLIKEPMDLQTMLQKAVKEEYRNYAWVREMFELMVLNALTFNRYYTDVWREAKRFYHDALENVFDKMGKAAPAGTYQKSILKCFEKAEEAKKNEEDRVQVDESVEKKDLVAGSAAVLTISLLPLRDAPPDLPSCVPFKDTWLKPVDAFYCSWMDSCFTCGSSGASDTFLFCVDCGEAFHSFCVSAPIHSMEPSSVAGWRCPNCKICEISGDVPADETRMLFCEMCDRGFSLDLVDPPLKSAPSGLWICGQCVDCKVCGNKAEKKGVSLKYWSQDPERCFRCGGCGVFDHKSSCEGKCHVCAGLLRDDDVDLVECHQCNSKVHISCDERAEEYLNREASTSRTQTVQKPTSNLYLCPTCYKPSTRVHECDLKMDDRKHLSDQAWQLIKEAKLGPHENYSDDELYQKLSDEIDWETRNQWRDEYIAIIRDAIGIYCMAKTLGDPRFVIQQVLQRMHQLPAWLGHRALRFAVLVKRKEWDTNGFANNRADVVVITAKLAAAFIDIVCRTLGISKERDVSFADRLADLVKAPGANGDFSCPLDRIKRSKGEVTFDESGILIDETESSTSGMLSPATGGLMLIGRSKLSSYKIASPLCGWSAEVRTPSAFTEWKDPRECCLCHLCGDDDAGLPDDSLPKDLAGLGRLLPMSDGFWVHTSCALWSSEVWEAPDDGFIHAVEKARSRGAQLKCFGCGGSGATVGCNKSNCPYNYHLPCARACGAVFTSKQQVFCAGHKLSAMNILLKESIEHMKALLVAPDKLKYSSDKDPLDGNEADLCLRVGSLVVHSLGTIETNIDGFHSENYITPPGYLSSRIFWSARRPRVRTVYILKIDQTVEGQAEFSIIPGDDPSAKMTGSSANELYANLMERVRKVNSRHFSQGNMFSKLPVVRRTRRKTYGLNGPQFFGFGLNNVRRLLETSPGVEAVAAPLTPCSSPQYQFCFAYGPGGSDSSVLVDLIRDLQRKRAAAKAEQASQNSTGCARTEGVKAVVKSGGSGRITRALVRSAEDETGDSGPSAAKKGEEKAMADKNLVQVRYRQMKAVPMEQRLVARRSHIHGWGLFTKIDISKHNPVVEYMGEVIRQRVADKREKAYELSGEGSCYMFRLDMKRIVDATKIGCMARFMNHSCQPNVVAKIMSVDTDLGQERKIVVFANRDIAAGEEITYDYKFPVEDGSIRCSCGAPNCIGRLN